MGLIIDMLHNITSESLYCVEVENIRYVPNQCFNRDQKSVRHWRLSKFLSCFLSGISMTEKQLVYGDCAPFAKDDPRFLFKKSMGNPWKLNHRW